MKKRHYLTALAALSLAACSDKKETTDTPPPSGGADIASVIVTAPPEAPASIQSVRQSAKAGETLTVTGQIMGDKTVLVDNRAIMKIGDPAAISACEPDEGCATPWDACCSDPDVIKGATLTVQVVDKDGKILKSGFRGVSGIKELSEVIVTGVVAEGSNKDNLMLNATAIYVKQ